LQPLERPGMEGWRSLTIRTCGSCVWTDLFGNIVGPAIRARPTLCVWASLHPCSLCSAPVADPVRVPEKGESSLRCQLW
jgi:hypothetical protein